MANAVNVFPPGFRVLDASGAVVPNATIEIYDAGSTVAKTVYADRELTVPMGSIVYTDTGGYPVAGLGSTNKTLVYTDEDPYKIFIKDADGVVIASHDEVVGAVVPGTSSGGGASDGITQVEADNRYLRNPNALATDSNIEDVDIIPFFSVADSGNRGIPHADYKTNIITEMRASGHMFPVGTRLAFQQAVPPTGWTQETGAAFENASVKFRTAAGTGATGGSVDFANVFKSWTFTGTVGATTLNVTQIPAHNHDFTFNLTGNESGSSNTPTDGATVTGSYSGTTANAGGGGSHTHSLTMTAANFSVKFVEFCIGQKS